MYRRVLQYLKAHKAGFISALLCMVIFGATDGVVPFLVKYILDGVFTNRDEKLLWILPGVLMGFAIIRAASDFGQQFLMARVGHQVTEDIRNDVNRHVLSLSPDFFVRHSTGELLSRVTSDVLLIRTLLTDSSATIIRDLIRLLALMGSCFYLDPTLSAIAIIFFPMAGVPIAKIGKKIRRLSKRGQDAIGQLSALFQESMQGHRVVKIFCREDYEQARFERGNHDLTRTFIKSERMRAAAGPINEVLASFAISGVLMYGGYTVISGVRSSGEFMAFLVSVFLMYEPFKKLTRVNATIQQGIAGAQRIFEIVDTKPSVTEPTVCNPLPTRYDVELKNVSYEYPARNGGDEMSLALDQISLVIPEGKKVALVGFSGSGKSTLVDLIPRFIDPSRGSVLLGGVDLRELSLTGLRRRIAMVGQHTFLFNDTIYNNIAYGNPYATRAEVEAAAKAAFAYDFIMQLPSGFESLVGEGGMTLSGGERQRLAIARAILKDAPILVLDEATASLDNRAEREVQSAIQALEQGRTTVVIAHRLSTIQDADLIVVMNKGRIVEQGTHAELLEKGGEFSRLHALQFRENEEAVVATSVATSVA
ncbi:MAG: lipid export permease/ATP-binding protein MsbA [Pseudomonadota bacterium]|jgi:subfamily B ATP-binding cassette protein MsbA